MNNQQYHQVVKKAAQKKYRGKKAVVSKYTPSYPNSAEREMKRISNLYLKLLNQTVKEHLPVIMAMYKEERHGSDRQDSLRDLADKVKQEIMLAAAELEQKLAEFGLYSLIEKVGKTVQASSLREWKKCVKSTLGIDLFEDYYKGGFYEDAIRRWIDENVLKIQSIPRNTLGEMQQIILNGFNDGETIRDITKKIQAEYDVTRSKARALARDQVGTLNAQITKMQQQDAGCNRYRWSTSGDSRVRDSHRALDGQTFSWDNPPEMWYITKHGIKKTGRRCHPGEDYACRCCAIPVFDIDTINIPIREMERSER